MHLLVCLSWSHAASVSPPPPSLTGRFREADATGLFLVAGLETVILDEDGFPTTHATLQPVWDAGAEPVVAILSGGVIDGEFVRIDTDELTIGEQVVAFLSTTTIPDRYGLAWGYHHSLYRLSTLSTGEPVMVSGEGWALIDVRCDAWPEVSRPVLDGVVQPDPMADALLDEQPVPLLLPEERQPLPFSEGVVAMEACWRLR